MVVDVTAPDVVGPEAQQSNAMKCPEVLSKTVLEMGMNFSVLDSVMCYEESMYHVCIVFWLDRIPIEDVSKVLWHASLILNDHVVQDDATYYDLPYDLCLQYSTGYV